MKQIKCYRYIGTNGTITSKIRLEGCPKLDMLYLEADNKKVLTDGSIFLKAVYIYPDEIENWKEIDDPNKGQM